ncbi:MULTISPECIES: YncE family protein [Legionella]|uniref:Lactonase, 7-bladed beta-propeller n=1 Tax=Legionella maceachernii TaxID=466 RepID=A0A0W0W3W9_9GAMM|nr:YncE family protein [Legionella maceachernii]KTD27152.1 Lactonase, 7-bladed beta-propeller [Legionella maceachernii]SKA13954.1 40-residue YVTN family beta-propeller repeat-containing protein [Legionella maceachernii]SUP04836.1 Streptogramin lyase [Legionella maceachernii]
MRIKRTIFFLASVSLIGLVLTDFIKNKPLFSITRSEAATQAEEITPLVTPSVYANANAGMLSDATKDALPRVYVPNSEEGTVSVIDPATYKVVDTFKTGTLPQHVVPSYDLNTLWVLNNHSNTVTPINPTTAKPGKAIRVTDPYNLYYTPDGRFAIVVCEAHRQLEFHDPQTMKLVEIMPAKCKGLNHMDFTQDNRYGVVTCEFSSQLMKFDVEKHKVVGYLSLGTRKTSMPQDIRLSPDGRTFYVADMMRDGVVLIDADSFREIGFIPTGKGTHAVYPSRDGHYFYVSNRGCHQLHCPPNGPGSITVIDPKTQTIVTNWPIPGGGSPDMGNVNADGTELWLSGRYDSEVYVFNTANGVLTHRIQVGEGPHGLTVWPQPGRFSLGHTGNMR